MIFKNLQHGNRNIWRIYNATHVALNASSRFLAAMDIVHHMVENPCQDANAE